MPSKTKLTRIFRAQTVALGFQSFSACFLKPINTVSEAEHAAAAAAGGVHPSVF